MKNHSLPPGFPVSISVASIAVSPRRAALFVAVVFLLGANAAAWSFALFVTNTH
jgi:hypothetical protein